jgi:hypothetical protein
MNQRATRISPLLLSIAFSFSSACNATTEPLPDGSRRVSAPPVYQSWWSMTESCSGRTGPLATIDWYVVPGVAQFEHKGTFVSGYWSSRDDRVVLAERAMLDGGLVRHEMLHALLGHAEHTRDAFLERCGGAVVCLTGCLQDVGSAPVFGPTITRVSPGEMHIDVVVEPGQPQRSVDEGHFRLMVTVTNPRDDSVLVLLPSSGDAPPASFNFLLNSGPTGLWFTEHAWDPGVTVFAPGATRRAVFDFKLADRFDGIRALPEGTYDIKGGFGPASSVTRSFIFGQSR